MGRRLVDGDRASQALQLAALVASVVLAAVINVLGARHFARWDWTSGKRWSLSPATLETLHSLEHPLDVWAIAGPGDPLEQSLRQTLAAYRAASARVEVHWIDPDRDAVQLVDLERRFQVEAGRSEDGRVVTDAIVVVASGDKHWFLTSKDMFEQADDVHVKPQQERALTQAIRSVLEGDRVKLCFTVGHGELSLEPSKDERDGLGEVRDLLAKSNYDLTSVDLTAPSGRPPSAVAGASDAPDPLAECAVAVVAGPRTPFSPEEAERLRAWALGGGSIFVAAGPLDADSHTRDDTGMALAGLDPVLAPFGVALDEDLIHDVDARVAIPDTHGEGFFVEPRPHPVTASLIAGESDPHPPRVTVFFARSLRHVSPASSSGAAAWASDLLVTSDEAYAKKSIVGAADWTDAPARAPTDARGPFVVAMASELSRGGSRGGAGAHGPRAVVVGSRFALAAEHWRQPRALHGAAFFVDSALSWLASRPAVIDVPDKPEVAATVRISEEGRDEVRRYVLVLMPAAALLLGVAVWAWRRSSENRPYELGATRAIAGEGTPDDDDTAARRPKAGRTKGPRRKEPSS